MELPSQVLVFGCDDASKKNSGLKADEIALEALKVPFTKITTGTVKRNDEGKVDSVNAVQIDSANVENAKDCKVVKLGALPSLDAINSVAVLLSANPSLSSILDSEAFFKSGPSDPAPDLVKELAATVLPYLTVLSATVPEAKKLLDAVGDTPVDYPQGMGDVMAMGNKLRGLGPKYIIVKREMLDEPFEEDQNASAITTLHYVLCDGGEAKMSASRCENDQRVFGVSYSIPAFMAGLLVQMDNVPEAVAGAFDEAKERLSGGVYYSP